MVGNVTKIDLMMDKGARGQFARFVVQIDLRKPLISKIRIASRIYRVEYESFPMVCFGYGSFGHLKGDCPQSKIVENMEKGSGEGQEKLTVSVTNIMNEKKFDGGNKWKNTKDKGHKEWVVDVKGRANKQAMAGPRIENQGVVLRKLG
ncbi:hypothetical protein J1N35_025302 [Gossypium stocksii]|uniref:Zinc knuckle CX2CX4HX4C domain-containing protein n=1 Tax=Gossypium stocksii TaxID=47602 RepID=A0A9D3V6A7_9ROSI|nr:hypothetical protein J1N35_025302 [Gossypium stocksii]